MTKAEQVTYIKNEKMHKEQHVTRTHCRFSSATMRLHDTSCVSHRKTGLKVAVRQEAAWDWTWRQAERFLSLPAIGDGLSACLLSVHRAITVRDVELDGFAIQITGIITGSMTLFRLITLPINGNSEENTENFSVPNTSSSAALGKKPLPMPVSHNQFPYGLLWD
jgi:hypothetical protein